MPDVLPPTRSNARRVGHGLGIVAILVGIVALTRAGRNYIDTEVAPGGSLSVAFTERPAWMSDALAQQIARTLPAKGASVFDQDLLKKAAADLAKSPWVKHVRQIRRVYGDRPGDRLEVDCEFRSPIAAVEWGSYYWLVDNDGVKLSEPFTAAELPRVILRPDGTPNLRVVKGVHDAPPSPGQVWAGKDLTAALDLVKLFDGQDFLDDVRAIDVSNFEGRVKRGSPQVVLGTRFDTAIWWGRPVNARDFFVEVPAAKKLETLKSAATRYGRIDANRPYFDIRYEYHLAPAADSTATTHEDGPR